MMREPIVTPDNEAAETSPPAKTSSASASAVAVPLLALGLLGVAVWLGSMPPPQPEPPAQPGAVGPAGQPTVDPLPSWRAGETKQAILEFVEAVSTEGGPLFVPEEERIAVFDHDGTLACEEPYINALFLIERIRRLVEQKPDLASQEPFATLLTGDLEFARRLGQRLLTELAAAASEGRPLEDLEDDVRAFLATARHPIYDTPLRDVTFQPMQELLALLRRQGFTIWLCSGSSVHFLRPVATEWYGIDPSLVIGSRLRMTLREEAGDPETVAGSKVVVLPELEQFNDGPQKPVSIAARIGRRPIFAAGNVGGGDLEMLRWSQQGERPSFQLLVLHDDADREFASDAEADAVVALAEQSGWHVASMAADWERVFARPLDKMAMGRSPEPDNEQPAAAAGEAADTAPAATDPPAAAAPLEARPGS